MLPSTLFHILEILYSTPIGDLLGYSLFSHFIFIVMKGNHGQPIIAGGYKIWIMLDTFTSKKSL